MKDPLGQEINVGSRVVWSGHDQGAGFSQIFTVEKVSASRVTIRRTNYGRPSTVPPTSVMVVDLILAAQSAAKPECVPL